MVEEEEEFYKWRSKQIFKLVLVTFPDYIYIYILKRVGGATRMVLYTIIASYLLSPEGTSEP